MENEFSSRVAVVTGASSGIGLRTAELLADRGARVILFARSTELLTAIAKTRAGMLAVSGDASNEADVERLFATTEKQCGPCDILINAAGMIDPAPLVETSPDRWDRMFAVNVRSAYLTSRRALPRMVERAEGAIVNVASISGVPGPEKFPGFASYNACKAAIIALTEALAVEVKKHGIRVNCVSPGSVDTKMWAAASGGAPADLTTDEVAESILFLASDRARAVNGQNLHVYSA
jgi:NAD(P)-dependent dehydrogenase (short-subunit alcohol dehydrogenase family)